MSLTDLEYPENQGLGKHNNSFKVAYGVLHGIYQNPSSMHQSALDISIAAANVTGPMHDDRDGLCPGVFQGEDQ